MKHWLIQQLIKLKNYWRASPAHTQPMIMKNLVWQPQLNDQGFQLRLCQQADINQFERIEKLAYDGYLAWRQQDFLKDWQKNPYALYLVIEKEDRIVGLINGRVLYKASHISQVMIEPDYQHQGLGQWAVTEWIKIAEQLGTKQITLEVRESNQAAQNLYYKLGFKQIDEREHYYYNNNETALIMCYRGKEKDELSSRAH